MLMFSLFFCGLRAFQSPSMKSYPDNLHWAATPHPCHLTDCATDNSLHCDSSPYQILHIPGSENQTHAKQKANLIIIDIDQTILDSHEGADGPVFYQWARYGEGITVSPMDDSDLVLMFLEDPLPYQIVFRKYFFEFLDYVHRNCGFAADLMVYTRARHDYVLNIVMAINAYYNKNYLNYLHDDDGADLPPIHGLCFLTILMCTYDAYY